MVGAVFYPIKVPCQAQYLDAVQLTLEGIDEATRIVGRTKGMRIVSTADEMEQAHNAGEIGVLLGLEGGHALGASVAVLRMFYSLGARYISLASYECSNPWIAAATTREPLFEENIPASITQFGKVSTVGNVLNFKCGNYLRLMRIFIRAKARLLSRKVPTIIL